MTAVVLVHQGLDLSLDVEPGEPSPGGGVCHRGGDRIAVTARADRAAAEWAHALGDPVVALAVGPPSWEPAMTWALARGGADAVRVWDETLAEADLTATALVVAAAARRLTADVIIGGERGIAGGTGALPALVAARLGWPCLDGAVRLTRDGDAIVGERRLSGGRRETVATPRPAVVTVAADSVEPRYVSVRARREAARRGHTTWTLADVGLTDEAVRAAIRLRVTAIDWPRPRARRTAATMPARSAVERLRRLVGGPARPVASGAPSGSSRLVEGTPREIADRILAFLSERGFV